MRDGRPGPADRLTPMWKTSKLSRGKVTRRLPAAAALRTLALLTVSVLLVSGAVTAIDSPGAAKPASADSETAAFIGYINQFRAANGVAALSAPAGASAAAQFMAECKAAAGSLGGISDCHDPPRNQFERLAAYGVSASSWAGFSAYGHETGAGMYNSYMSQWSPFFDLFCDPKYNAIGVGRTHSANYGWLWHFDVIRLSGSGPYPDPQPCEAVPISTNSPTPPATPIATPTPTPTIAPSATPTATPTEAPDSTPTPSPTPTATPGPTATPTPTPSAPTPTPTPTPKTLEAGDVDCDGAVSSVDALRVLMLVAALTAEECGAVVDVNCDLVLGADDALVILLFLVGRPATLPDGCPPIGSA